jgi:DnaK suppressor protein
MSPKHITHFQRLLTKKQEELAQALRMSLDDLAVQQITEHADQVQYFSVRDAALRNVDREVALLRRIKAALESINDQSFGTCALCAEEIPLKRLRAVPWARLCVECQRRAEAGELPRTVGQAAAHAA